MGKTPLKKADDKKKGTEDSKKKGTEDSKKKGTEDSKKKGAEDSKKKKAGTEDKKKGKKEDNAKKTTTPIKKKGQEAKAKAPTVKKKEKDKVTNSKPKPQDSKRTGSAAKKPDQKRSRKKTSQHRRKPEKAKSDERLTDKKPTAMVRRHSDGDIGKSTEEKQEKKPETPARKIARPSPVVCTPLLSGAAQQQATHNSSQLLPVAVEEDDNEYENLSDFQRKMQQAEEPAPGIEQNERKEEAPMPMVAEVPPEIVQPDAKLVEMDDMWRTVIEGQPFPSDAVQALGRPLLVDAGNRQEHFVGLWYRHGEPIMGRVWNNQGKLAACFTHDGRVYQKNFGRIQVLCEYPPTRCGFRYMWQPFSFARAPSGGWYAIKVGHSIPCVVKTTYGYERLGNVNFREERATAAWLNEEVVFMGPQVRQFLVLFRKP